MGRKKGSSNSKRTKSVKKEPQELSEEKRMFLEQLDKEVQSQLRILETQYQSWVDNFEDHLKLIFTKLGDEVLNTLWVDIPTSEPVQRTSQHTETRRRSKSCSSVFAVPEAPVPASALARTVPRVSRAQSTCNLRTQFQTPANQGIPSLSMITPKFSQNKPLAVMRRPRQGEWAISMSGSPLLVSSAVHENLVNVNIPMDNGSVLSILPQAGLERNDIPTNLSETTKQQLHAILQNLNVILHD